MTFRPAAARGEVEERDVAPAAGGFRPLDPGRAIGPPQSCRQRSPLRCRRVRMPVGQIEVEVPRPRRSRRRRRRPCASGWSRAARSTKCCVRARVHVMEEAIPIIVMNVDEPPVLVIAPQSAERTRGSSGHRRNASAASSSAVSRSSSRVQVTLPRVPRLRVLCGEAAPALHRSEPAAGEGDDQQHARTGTAQRSRRLLFLSRAARSASSRTWFSFALGEASSESFFRR